MKPRLKDTIYNLSPYIHPVTGTKILEPFRITEEQEKDATGKYLDLFEALRLVKEFSDILTEDWAFCDGEAPTFLIVCNHKGEDLFFLVDIESQKVFPVNGNKELEEKLKIHKFGEYRDKCLVH